MSDILERKKFVKKLQFRSILLMTIVVIIGILLPLVFYKVNNSILETSMQFFSNESIKLEPLNTTVLKYFYITYLGLIIIAYISFITLLLKSTKDISTKKLKNED